MKRVEAVLTKQGAEGKGLKHLSQHRVEVDISHESTSKGVADNVYYEEKKIFGFAQYSGENPTVQLVENGKLLDTDHKLRLFGYLNPE